ncbi:hypothetical protein BDR07DRAFT_1412316 [Suillus spraguei]|nr:hypothetical protein BDR07DRAFT_1412316 [Suillus spraguei]
MQDVAGKSGDHGNMIIRDITGEMLRIVTNVFEPENIRIPNSPHSQRLPNAPLMDDITENWPIPTELEDDFDGIKYTHRALPLPVFRDGIPISPLDINRTLGGALVEVHFEVHHWHVSGYDSFQAKAERIDILRDSALIPSKHYLNEAENNKKLPK